MDERLALLRVSEGRGARMHPCLGTGERGTSTGLEEGIPVLVEYLAFAKSDLVKYSLDIPT